MILTDQELMANARKILQNPACHIEDFVTAIETYNEAEARLPPKQDEFQPGYHTKPILKGVYGDASKIMEEATEFADAVSQGAKIMALVELSDLYGAMKAYVEKHSSMTMDDVIKMHEITDRAFKNGHRR